VKIVRMAHTIDQARDVFERRRAAWLGEDVAGYLGCWVDDLVFETPGRPPVEGRDAYEAMVRQSFAWAKPRAFVFHHLAVEGDVVLADWTISVERRHDGGTVEWGGMSVAELREGKIVWWREYYDDPAALARAARG
jgi:ketosteroid isomerase-like protein